MKEREALCSAIAHVLTVWLEKGAEVTVINPQTLYFACNHGKDADLTVLRKLGIPVPKNPLEEKQWKEGSATFDFFLTREIHTKICNKIIEYNRIFNHHRHGENKDAGDEGDI
jgi:hypothetical protein